MRQFGRKDKAQAGRCIRNIPLAVYDYARNVPHALGQRTGSIQSLGNLMAFGPRLEFRQTQSLVMTPQLLQAIKLLQLSTIELASYVETELERNPLLERQDDPDAAPLNLPATGGDAPLAVAEGDWASDELRTDRQAIEGDIGTDLSNAFPDDAAAPAQPMTQGAEGPTLPSLDGGMRIGKGGSFDSDDSFLDSIAARGLSLQDHLENQAMAVLSTAADRGIALAIIENIEETGYLAVPLEEIATRLGAEREDVEAILAVIQQCEPAGVGARNLAECLALQLKERDRFDPAMAMLVSRLDLLAARDFQQLKRICRVDDEDLAGMVGEIRRLDPKPGLIFGGEPVQAVVPDVFIRAAADGGWAVELNSDALPRVIANRSYYARVSKTRDKEGKSFIDEAWASANWLTRSLEQRAKTILKVASEIVRQQDSFFMYGVQHLKPLNLKTIAEAVSLHESTISRVTSNKYMATPRGLFEMKYFFTASIAGAPGEEAHSAEAVRFRIRQLIAGESPQDVLSDDALVTALKTQGVDIARRTIAKYREAMRIPSSAIRRREKKAMSGRE
jgi:RNA polymerase sigma-54 factor